MRVGKHHAPGQKAKAIFTDDSKLDGRVGCGIYSPVISVIMSLKTPDHYSVLQTELFAILQAAEWLHNSTA